MELLVSDNASLDTTQEFLSTYKPRFSNIQFKHWTNPVNVGATQNLKILLREASADYVLVLTDDDILLPSGLLLILTQLLHKKPSFLKSSLLVNTIKTKASFVYGSEPELLRYDGCIFSDALRCLRYSHVFSGCVFSELP